MNRKRKNRDRDRRQQVNNWPSQKLDQLAALLHMCAPAIEAAGSIDNALNCGALTAPPEGVKLLRSIVPESRGGEVRSPTAIDDWLVVVREAVDMRQIDMEKMRREFRNL